MKNTKFRMKWPRNEAAWYREGYKSLCLSWGRPTDICDELMGICFIIMLHDLDIQFFYLYQTLPELKNMGEWAWVNIKWVPDSWPRTLHQIFFNAVYMLPTERREKSVITSTGGRARQGMAAVNLREVRGKHRKERKGKNQVSSGRAAGCRRLCLLFHPQNPHSRHQKDLQCAFQQFFLITFTFHVSSVPNNPLDIKTSHS